ncbi:MAG: amidohydrolase [Erysipelotrichaceae bacterium]|nr:amidohydrolase [Erysipelotrichaceae bacterium]
MNTINNEEMLELADRLLRCPELGYKEYGTKKILTQYLRDNGFTIENECFETAFSVSVGKGRPHIGLIAELDAIPTLGHRYADPKDQYAAHACGHSSQCAIMASVMTAFKKTSFKGKVTLFFTPGEEYTDIRYREKLIKEKKIKYIGGKINMLEKGLFDDCDIIYHLHAMGENGFRYSIDSDLAGFVYKKITFRGRAAHAAVAPHLGINALNAYALFNDALNMLRETFREKDSIRIHGYISEGGQTVNSIPERVVYECYVRTMNADVLVDLSQRVDNAARHCAKALGASAHIETRPGYLPFKQNRELSQIVYKEMLKHVKDEEIEKDSPSMAAGDIGDVSIFKPAIQIGYGGFTGIPHGKTFLSTDPEVTYIGTADIIYNSVLEMLKRPELIRRIVKEYRPRMSREEYEAYING